MTTVFGLEICLYILGGCTFWGGIHPYTEKFKCFNKYLEKPSLIFDAYELAIFKKFGRCAPLTNKTGGVHCAPLWEIHLWLVALKLPKIRISC